jgi:hypothetical protein
MSETRKYSDEAVSRAREAALDWLEGRQDGYPRSWAQEVLNEAQRGYELYDDFEAPPIAGYESLERDGLVVRGESVIHRGQERIHFKRGGGEDDRRPSNTRANASRLDAGEGNERR